MENLQTFFLLAFVIGLGVAVTCNREHIFPEEEQKPCDIEAVVEQKLPDNYTYKLLYLEDIEYTLLTPTLWVAEGIIGEKSTLPVRQLLIENLGFGCSGERYLLMGLDSREEGEDHIYVKGGKLKINIGRPEGIDPENPSSILVFYQKTL